MNIKGFTTPECIKNGIKAAKTRLEDGYKYVAKNVNSGYKYTKELAQDTVDLAKKNPRQAATIAGGTALVFIIGNAIKNAAENAKIKRNNKEALKMILEAQNNQQISQLKQIVNSQAEKIEVLKLKNSSDQACLDGYHEALQTRKA